VLKHTNQGDIGNNKWQGEDLDGGNIATFHIANRSQTKTQSAVETCVTVGIGYCVAMISQFILYPFFDIQVTFSENAVIAGWFTVISLIRSYFVRRMFNAIHARAGH